MSEGSDVKPCMEGKRNLASFLTGDEQTIKTYQILGHGKSKSYVHPLATISHFEKGNCISTTLAVG
jgi:hypothetical protein